MPMESIDAMEIAIQVRQYSNFFASILPVLPFACSPSPPTHTHIHPLPVQNWDGLGWELSPRAIEWWDHLHFLGFHNVAPIGGSDDHHGGQNESHVGPWEIDSAIGHPATMVLAANLSHAAIREGLLLGRTVLKMASALDPMADVTATLSNGESARVGGTLVAPSIDTNVTFEVIVSLPSNVTVAGLAAAVMHARRRAAAPGDVLQVQFVRNNAVYHREDVVVTAGGSSQVVRLTAPAPSSGTDRWRAEVHDMGADGKLRTLTNHIFIVATVQ